MDAFASAFAGLSLEVLFLDFAVRHAELVLVALVAGMCVCSAAALPCGLAGWPAHVAHVLTQRATSSVCSTAGLGSSGQCAAASGRRCWQRSATCPPPDRLARWRRGAGACSPGLCAQLSGTAAHTGRVCARGACTCGVGAVGGVSLLAKTCGPLCLGWVASNRCNSSNAGIRPGCQHDQGARHSCGTCAARQWRRRPRPAGSAGASCAPAASTCGGQHRCRCSSQRGAALSAHCAPAFAARNCQRACSRAGRSGSVQGPGCSLPWLLRSAPAGTQCRAAPAAGAAAGVWCAYALQEMPVRLLEICPVGRQSN